MRLNAKIRKAILKAITERRLEKMDAKLDELTAKVGPAVYASLWPDPPTNENLKDWITKRSSFTYLMRDGMTPKGNNDVLTYPFLQLVDTDRKRTEKFFSFEWGEMRYVPKHMHNNSRIEASDLDKIPAFQAWEKQIEACARLRRQIYEEVWPLLHTSTTVAGLLKNWPEVKPFIPAPDKPKPVNALVPVEKIQAVNSLVELP